MKQSLLQLTQTAIFSQIVGLLEQGQDRRINLLRVLTYHRIDEPDAKPHLSPDILSVTPAGFEAQMRFIAAHYQPIAVQQVLDYYAHGAALPPRAVLVTFDDAYADFAKHAMPILKRFIIPATLFVPTSYPDNPSRSFWWDQLYHAIRSTTHLAVKTPVQTFPLTTVEQRVAAFKQMRTYIKSLSHEEAMTVVDTLCHTLEVNSLENEILSWDELKTVAKDGVTLGAHTRTHPLLNRISPDHAQQEILGSLKDITQAVGVALPIFAYPSGGFSDEVVQVLATSGVKLAFTTVRGINDLRTAHPLRLRRIQVGLNTSLGLLHAQLLSQSILLNRFVPG